VENVRNLPRSELVRPARHILDAIRNQVKKIGIGFSLQKSGLGKIRNGRIQMPPSPALSMPVHAMADGTVCPVNFLSRIQPPGSDTMCRDQGRQKKNDPTKPDRQRPFSGHPAPLIYFQCAFTPAFIIYLFPELSLVIPFLTKDTRTLSSLSSGGL
jgi:hypothetical protein